MGHRVTTKGQVTIPKAVRDELGIKAGDEVEFLRANGSFQVRKKLPADPFAEWRGSSKWMKGRSVDELMDEMRGR